MFEGANNGGHEFEPTPLGMFWPAFILFAYAMGALIAMVT